MVGRLVVRVMRIEGAGHPSRRTKEVVRGRRRLHSVAGAWARGRRVPELGHSVALLVLVEILVRGHDGGRTRAQARTRPRVSSLANKQVARRLQSIRDYVSLRLGRHLLHGTRPVGIRVAGARAERTRAAIRELVRQHRVRVDGRGRAH